jgi:NADH-quinone oxidoreductase subunit C
MTNEHILARVTAACGPMITGSSEFRGDLTLTVRTADIVPVCRFLRDDPELSFEMLIDLLGVDMARAEGRFEVVYTLSSLKHPMILRLKVVVDQDHASVPTVTGVWKAADWHERETFDMFGVRFEGHPDLRRMYMPEEYEYFPLRKDFPLMGIPDSIPLPRN